VCYLVLTKYWNLISVHNTHPPAKAVPLFLEGNTHPPINRAPLPPEVGQAFLEGINEKPGRNEIIIYKRIL